MAVFEKRREVPKADVTVFVNGGADNGTAILAIPFWVIGSPAEKGDPERRSAHNHRAGIANALFRRIRILSLWNNTAHWTSPT